VIEDWYLSTSLDAVEAAEIQPAPAIGSREVLADLLGLGRIALPLPVVHIAAESEVAAALDISLSQLERILGGDLAIDADTVTWDLDEAPQGAGTGVATVVRFLHGAALTHHVPVPPASERTPKRTSDLEVVLDACAHVRRCIAAAGPVDAAHQALYDAVWMLVWNART